MTSNSNLTFLEQKTVQIVTTRIQFFRATQADLHPKSHFTSHMIDSRHEYAFVECRASTVITDA